MEKTEIIIVAAAIVSLALGLAIGYFAGSWKARIYYKAAQQTLDYCNQLSNFDIHE